MHLCHQANVTTIARGGWFPRDDFITNNIFTNPKQNLKSYGCLHFDSICYYKLHAHRSMGNNIRQTNYNNVASTWTLHRHTNACWCIGLYVWYCARFLTRVLLFWMPNQRISRFYGFPLATLNHGCSHFVMGGSPVTSYINDISAHTSIEIDEKKRRFLLKIFPIIWYFTSIFDIMQAWMLASWGTLDSIALVYGPSCDGIKEVCWVNQVWAIVRGRPRLSKWQQLKKTGEHLCLLTHRVCYMTKIWQIMM